MSLVVLATHRGLLGMPMGVRLLPILFFLLGLAPGAYSQDWEHKSNAWVPGPFGTSVRSPYESPQPTAITWSMVPGGVAHSNDADRETDDFIDMEVTGLTSLSDYQAVLRSAVDEWASVADITNLGYVHETGAVPIGPSGLLFENRGPAANVGHVRFMTFDQEALNGASAYAQATCIPEPGTSVDNGYNLPRAGDIRFRSDANLWTDLLGEVYFRNIALHELGHIFGFGHNTVSDSVMYAPYTELNLGTGDIAGAVYIYGPPGGGSAVPEPNALLLAIGGLFVLSFAGRRR